MRRYKKHLCIASIALALSTTLLGGCEYAFSDAATRIRYALLDAKSELQRSGKDSLTLAIRPNHTPDGCENGSGFRVVLTPYKGNKQVAVGDIFVNCEKGRHYSTGFGSAEIGIAGEMSVNKNADDDVRISLRKTETGVEIVGLE